MTRPTARVLTLLELLQSGGVRTLADLSERLGVDARTVRRYVQHLVDLDIPVESVRGRYGGYRLARGHRLPPLMLGEDEALAVLLGLTGQASTAAETAAAKLRRVLPQRLDALRDALASTAPGASAPDGAILLPLAVAVRDHQPVRLDSRTFFPYGVVAHNGRWYVTGLDPSVGEQRTFRLDRISQVRGLPGSFTPPDGFDPVERVLTGFATAPYRHEIHLRIEATEAQIRRRLPPSLAVVHGGADGWLEVSMRAESLEWIPALLASVDRPFVIDSPAELRTLVAAFAARVADYATRTDR
ncbi:YafY family protein [Actinoplanes sp. L3-i22]|uniref:helix-turn-helix transcriptional regulator n=1 Tax=Actinoplanes sp. L3-i22 TaxID=2836373 RepID=UPI001C76FA32|nr:WYL domain-containing protein [Actinoplanes sp. L3-i22]BCY10557.1 transcriptional regulator [Actinoplanes sp. L3-i22]